MKIRNAYLMIDSEFHSHFSKFLVSQVRKSFINSTLNVTEFKLSNHLNTNMRIIQNYSTSFLMSL